MDSTKNTELSSNLSKQQYYQLKMIKFLNHTVHIDLF